MSRHIKPIGMRIPEELRIWLREQATANHRSLNGEIVARLEHSRGAQYQPEPATEALERACARLGIPTAAVIGALAEILETGAERPGSHESALAESLIAAAKEAGHV